MIVNLPDGRWRVDALGRWYPDICGAATDEEDHGDDDTDDDGTDDKPKTFTQRQVNRIMANEKRQGKELGIREVMEQLGTDSLDDAKALLEEVRNRDSKANDDADKRLRKAEERERKADDLARKAIVKANTADVLAALIGENMEKKKAVLAVRLVDLDLSTEDLSEDEILEAVDTLKDAMPELFGPSAEKEDEKEWRPVGSPDSTPRGGKRRTPQTMTNKERAAQRLAERHPEFAKK
jgi:hypothetical protein